MHWLNNRIDSSRSERTTEQPIDSFENIHFQFADQLLLILFHQVDVTRAFEGDFSNAVRDDLGTFTVLLGDEELLTDPGAEVYTNRTFSKDRYDGQLLNSFGHPVPVVVGQLQKPGEDAESVLLEARFGEEEDKIVLDLKPAYELATLEVLTRSFLFQRSGQMGVTVKDRVVYSEPESFETALITYAKWEACEDGSILIGDGNNMLKVTVASGDGELDFAHCVIEESSKPTRLSWRFRQSVKEAELTIRIVVGTA